MAGGGIKGGFGSFLLRRAAGRSIRQRHSTGPQFYKRKNFQLPKGVHQLHRRVAPAAQLSASPTQQVEYQRYAHLPGDVRRRPSEDFTFSLPEHGNRSNNGGSSSSASNHVVDKRYYKRKDKALYAWDKQGSLQLYQMGGKKETFVCYRCGYPVRSALVVVKDDNWDWRMCYNCYTKMAEAADVYTRPEGMSDRQEEIIQHVAEYVVASCDSAKYQKKLKQKTKYNSYFAFLDVRHPYHAHYTYLVQSYRYWMEQASAMERSSGLLAGTEDEAMNDIHNQYDNNSYDNGYHYPYQQQQQQDQSFLDYGADPTAPPLPSSPPSAPPVGHMSTAHVHQHDQGGHPQPSSTSSHANNNEEDGEEAYEMVMQNGVQTLVPRRR